MTNTIEEADRGIPDVNAKKIETKESGKYIMFVLAVLAALALLYFQKFKNQANQKQTKPKQTISQSNTLRPRAFDLPQKKEPPKPPTPKAQAPIPVAPKPPAQPKPLPAPPQKIVRPRLDPSSSSLVMISGQKSPSKATADKGNSNYITGDNESNTTPFSKLLNAHETPGAYAKTLPDRNFIIAKGAYVDCVLRTAINSSVPGMTECVLSRDIYSDNGKVLLLERGSQVVGEYKSNIQRGMTRIFVLWTRIKTPSGVVIDLNSPGIGALGEAGVTGYIDTHFWERFGAAILLSLVDDAGNSWRRNNNNNPYQNTTSSSQNLIDRELSRNANIPPTIHKNQGEHIGIYIARDLDFSTVYALDVR